MSLGAANFAVRGHTPQEGVPGPPPGHRIVTLAERPDLWEPMGRHNMSAWPEFMLHDDVVDEHWHHLLDSWPGFQFVLLDGDDRIAAAGNSAPLPWDGTEAGLPDGWDEQMLRSVERLATGTPANTLGALQIVVAHDRRGGSLSRVMVEQMREIGRAHGHRALIACVRPTLKDGYPLVPIERYARWTRADGLPFDPWIRVHVRAGGQIVRPSPRSMTIAGPVAEWEDWSSMALPESGDYVVPGAAAPVHVDREADRATYHDPNVWVVHRLDGSRAGQA